MTTPTTNAATLRRIADDCRKLEGEGVTADCLEIRADRLDDYARVEQGDESVSAS